MEIRLCMNKYVSSFKNCSQIFFNDVTNTKIVNIGNICHRSPYYAVISCIFARDPCDCIILMISFS